jgi:hypothetical protein
MIAREIGMVSPYVESRGEMVQGECMMERDIDDIQKS